VQQQKKRGLSSPDVAEALALTLAYLVAPVDNTSRLVQEAAASD
jgi:hypothetical protein